MLLRSPHMSKQNDKILLQPIQKGQPQEYAPTNTTLSLTAMVFLPDNKCAFKS